MNGHAPHLHVVMDLDGTTPPITVVSGQGDREYLDAMKKRCKKTVDFRNDYRLPESTPLGPADACKRQLSACCSCDADKQKKFWQKRFPVLRIMRKYKWRDDLPNDVISGLTVGIMQLPQGMAYALLAELPPVVGLYMAFFPVLVYFLLGSSRHISMGTVALCSLLTGSVISRFYDPALAPVVLGNDTSALPSQLPGNVTPYNVTDVEPMAVELPNHVKIAIASSICLLVGLIQLGMGVFRLGFITTYMSDPLIGGFTTGAAVHVGTSQMKYIFGLNIPRSDGVYQIIKTYVLIVKHIAETNLPTLMTSVICIVIIYVIKVQVNTRFKHKMKFPVPVELFVVISCTVLSYFFKFSENYKMKVVGEIPAGLPRPTMPTLPAVGVYSGDAIIIAVVAFSQSVGLAAIFAKKHGYGFDSNQELIAYGAGNIFGSFFSCYPYAASVSRSSVQESAGGKTQLASVFSAVLVLIIIVSIGPLFQTLPNCVLAAIIVVALRGLLLQVLELPTLWRTSRHDCWIWLVTFLAVVLLHVDYGIMIGVLFSFFTVVVRSQRVNASNLQKIDEVHIYENSEKYSKTQSNTGIKIIGFASPLYYANGALFVKQVHQISGVVPEKRRKRMKTMLKCHPDLNKRLSVLPLVNESKELGSVQSLEIEHRDFTSAPNFLDIVGSAGSGLYHIVIDCSQITFIDTVGAKVIKQLCEDYDSVNITVLLASVHDELWRVLEVTGFTQDYADRIFLTVDDAVNDAKIISQQLLYDVTMQKYPMRMMYPANNNPVRMSYRENNPVHMSYRENNNPEAAEDDALLTCDYESML